MSTDVVMLNLATLNIARQMISSCREDAYIKLGLSSAQCDVLESLSYDEVQTLASTNRLLVNFRYSADEIKKLVEMPNGMLKNAFACLNDGGAMSTTPA